MKKLTILALTVALTLSLAACGDDGAEKDTGVTGPNDPTVVIQEDSFGSNLLLEIEALDENIDTFSLAEHILTVTDEYFMGSIVIAEPGPLTGFDAEEITGFTEAYMIAPSISTIPYISYVFNVEGDPVEFRDMLLDATNPAWNVCTRADETHATIKGNNVFFIMCPTTLEDN